MSETMGRFVLETITDKESKERIIGVLMRSSKNSSREKIEQTLSQLPAILIKNIASEKADMLAKRLEAAGAKVRFIPFSRPSAEPVRKAEVSPRPGQPSSMKKAAIFSQSPMPGPVRKADATSPSSLEKAAVFSDSSSAKEFVFANIGKIVFSLVIILICLGIGIYLHKNPPGPKLFTTILDKQLVNMPETVSPVYDQTRGEYVFRIGGKKYSLADDYAKWSKRLYADKKFDMLETHIASLLAEKSDPAKMYELYVLYNSLGGFQKKEELDEMRDTLDQWCVKSSQSHIPWLVRGRFFIEYAWIVRGGGHADEVKKSAWPEFLKALNIAKENLEKSFELNPGDPNSSCFLLIVSKGLGLSESTMETYFRNAVSACPKHFGAHYHKLQYLKPKWHGSEKKMFGFARECMALSGQDPFMGIMMADVWEEVHRHNKKKENVLGSPKVWEEVERIYTAFFDKYPNDFRRRFFYANHALLAQKYDIATEQFEIIGDRWMPGICWPSVETFNISRGAAYYGMGAELLGLKGQPEASLEYFLEANRCHPSANGYYGLGIAYWKTGYEKRDISMLEMAETALTRALDIEPGHKLAQDQLPKLRQNLERGRQIERQRSQ